MCPDCHLCEMPTTEERINEPGVFGRSYEYGGIFIREFIFRKGEGIGGHAHKLDHLSKLESGSASVQVGDEIKHYAAPAYIPMPKGVVHKIIATAEPTIWHCIFAATRDEAYR